MGSVGLASLAVIQLSFLFTLTDGRTFLPARFNCGNGYSLPSRFLCDGNNDCINGADEKNCDSVRFDCGNGHSVPGTLLCDGNIDCGNGADEKNCRNPRFDCGNGYTIPRSYLCDGDDDCRNEADEKNCRNENPVSSTTENPESPVSSTTKHPEIPVSSTTESPGKQASSTTENPVTPVENVTGNPGNQVPRTTENPESRFVSGVFYDCGNNRYVRTHSLCNGKDDCGNLDDERNCNQKPVCGGPLIAQPSENEFFSHPKFGDVAYGENLTCDWVITGRPEKHVKITFPIFDVGIADRGCVSKETGNCVQYSSHEEITGKDFVEIFNFDGPDGPYKKIGKYAGNQRPPTITSEGPNVLVRFQSGDTGSFRGFHALYREV